MVLNLKVLIRSRSLAPVMSASRAATAHAAVALTRHFVLTGDERCPIAGIWSRIDTGAQPDSSDDPSLPLPAMATAPWRAIHLLFTSLRYLPA